MSRRKAGDAVATPEPFASAGAAIGDGGDAGPPVALEPAEQPAEAFEAITPITTTTTAGERVLLALGQKFALGYLSHETLMEHLKRGSIIRA